MARITPDDIKTTARKEAPRVRMAAETNPVGPTGSIGLTIHSRGNVNLSTLNHEREDK